MPPAIEDWVGSQLRSRPLDRAESLVLRRADGMLIVRLVLETADGPDRLVLQRRSANSGDGSRGHSGSLRARLRCSRELKFAATDLKLFRRQEETAIGH